MEILSELGTDDIFKEKEITINKDKLIKYIEKREKVFRYLFNLKEININEIQKDEKCLQILIKYINSRLKYLFNITLKCSDKSNNLYKISGLEVWNEKYNPFQENDDLLMDYNIKNMLNDIF
jgi:prenyltransferase beta subunit